MSVWANGLVWGVVLLAGQRRQGGVPVAVDDQPALARRMEVAEGKTSLDGPPVRPWHLKVSFAFGPGSPHPGETGTVEEWWAGATKDRIVYTSPSFSATEIHNRDGFFRTQGAGLTPYVLRLVRQQMVHPLPPAAVVNYSELHLEQRKVGDVALECVAVQSARTKSVERTAFHAPTYCFQRGTGELVASFDYALQVVARLREGRFQGRVVPMETTVAFGGEPAVSAKLETLESATVSDADFEPAAGVVKAPEVVQVDSRAVGDTDPKTVNGAAISQPKPEYPQAAKGQRVSGTVLVRLLIGKDGRVREADLIHAPHKLLGDAALAALKNWTYKPYMVDDEPTEVETIVAVNFGIGS